MVVNDNYLRKDVIYFNFIMVFLLAVIAIVLLYAPSNGSFPMFIPIACMIFNMIVTYNVGLQRGLMVAIVLTFVYGSYIIYEAMLGNRIAEVNFAYISWLFFILLAVY